VLVLLREHDMTIEKGKEWGQVVSTPPGVVVVGTDVALVQAWKKNNDSVIAVRGGDLFKALGQPATDLTQSTIRVAPIDLFLTVVHCEDGTVLTEYAASSIEIGSWRTRRRYVCISNTGFVNTMNIAPRAHPNDGEMDVVTVSASMDWRQRFIARRRAQLGNHVPHPHISMERGTEASWSREYKREVLSIDGHSIGKWSRIVVTVMPDACLVAL